MESEANGVGRRLLAPQGTRLRPISGGICWPRPPSCVCSQASLADHAVVRQLAVIGEAASHLPAGVTDRHPAIPWRGVKGMRPLLDHEYHRTDHDIVWRTIREELPPLREAIRAEVGR